ncbi:MAG: SPASM domain-containing protein, partial [Candidatus Aenigmatarchaeota archaeon]
FNKVAFVIRSQYLLNNDMAERLVSDKLDRILISLDGPSANINDKIRGKGTFNRIVQSIRRINEYKDKLDSQKPKIQVSSVINSYNYDKIREMLLIAETLDINELELHQMLVYEDTEEDVENMVLGSKQKEILMDDLKKVKELSENSPVYFNADALRLYHEGNESRPNGEDEIDGQFFCFEPFYTILIDMLGRVAPCCPGGSSPKEVDIKNRSLEDVWYGDYLSRIRKRIRNGIKMNICEKCGVNNLKEDLLNEFNR